MLLMRFTERFSNGFRDIAWKQLSKRTPEENAFLALIPVVGAVTGFFTGMSMIWYMNKFDYGLVVGGKPLFTPLFAFPVSYELTILLGAFATLFGMLFLNRLPRLHHPLLGNARFKRASDDRFFVCIESADPKYASEATRKFLVEECHATAVEFVEE